MALFMVLMPVCVIPMQTNTGLGGANSGDKTPMDDTTAESVSGGAVVRGLPWRRRLYLGVRRLIWLLPLLVLLAIAVFVLLRWQLSAAPILGVNVSPPAMVGSNPLVAEEQSLRNEINGLTIALTERRLQCPVSVSPSLPITSAPEPAQAVAPEPPAPEESVPEEPLPEAAVPEESVPEESVIEAPDPEPIPEEEPPVEPPLIEEPEADPDPLEDLASRIDTAECPALEGLITNEPLLKGNNPRTLELRRTVIDKLKENCHETLIKQAKLLCPGERPEELAPELVIVFDASGSMRVSLLATPEELQQAGHTRITGADVVGAVVGAFMGRNINLGNRGLPAHLLREPTRITAARTAAISVAQQVPVDVNVGLVTIESCPSARSVGYFPSAQRADLLGRLRSIQPAQGTPLGDAISKAGELLDGVDRESVMLVVSDGEDSCGSPDPCAIASVLGVSKPHLTINVVDILGTGAGNCLAEATGGTVYTANNLDELTLMTRKAAEDVLLPEHCVSDNELAEGQRP